MFNVLNEIGFWFSIGAIIGAIIYFIYEKITKDY